MKLLTCIGLIAALGVTASLGAQTIQPAAAPRVVAVNLPTPFDDHTGFTQIFDGASLKDWEGDPDFWRVENGAIVGESTADKPLSNTYIWRRNLELKDFDLKLEIKCEIGGGSGIQYRSQVGLPWRNKERPGEKPHNLQWMLTGPQADIWFPIDPQHAALAGNFFSENTGRGNLARRGEVVTIKPGMKPAITAYLGDPNELGGWVKINGWNQYEIIARGGVMMHFINGHLMTVLIDDDPQSNNNQPGKIGIELETTPSKVSVRNVWVRELK